MRAFSTFCVISVTMAVPSIVVAQSNTGFDGHLYGRPKYRDWHRFSLQSV